MLLGSLDGAGVWERMDTCLCMAEFFCSPPETAFLISHACMLCLQLRLTLRPMDCSALGSAVHGILGAGLLEWIATPFSTGSS